MISAIDSVIKNTLKNYTYKTVAFSIGIVLLSYLNFLVISAASKFSTLCRRYEKTNNKCECRVSSVSRYGIRNELG
jgi:uncharacterized membrane protein